MSAAVGAPSWWERPSQLCEACRNIDFEKYISHQMGGGFDDLFGVKWRHLTTWKSIKRTTNCPFCRLVVAAVNNAASPPPREHDTIQLRNEKSWKLSTQCSSYDGSRSEDYSNKWDLEKAANQTRSDTAYRFLVSWKGCRYPAEIQYLAHNDPADKRQFYGRPVEPSRVNWNVIGDWLEICNHCHLGSCDTPGLVSNRLPHELRLIDVKRWCIVNAPRGRPKYIALSYVWGEDDDRGGPMPSLKKQDLGPNRGQGEVVLSLRDCHVVQTIKDAMWVTERLGISYLWVDLLCIVQNDNNEKEQQMDCMDAVYNCATLTIAAAAGKHAEHGIPGVSIKRSFQQQSERVRDLQLAVCFPKYNRVELDHSLYWNTQGWVLQEKLLSQKVLLFTDYQVYYQCSNAIWTEDVKMEYYGELANKRRRRPSPFRWAPERQLRHISFWYPLADFASLGRLRLTETDEALGYFPTYIAIVEEIFRHSLRNPKDLLPAVTGLLRSLEPKKEHAFIAGLPKRYMTKALLWQPQLSQSLVSRCGRDHPTWSWAAWNLPRGCRWPEEDLRGSGGLPIPGTTYEFVSSHNPADPEKKDAILVRGARMKDFSIDTRECLDDDVIADFRIVDNDYRCVGEVRTTGREAQKHAMHDFWAISKGLSLQFAEPDPNWRPQQDRHEYVHNVTRQKEGYLPRDWKSGEYKFNIVKVDMPREDWPVFNAMLIDRTEHGATRRGLGRVLQNAWGMKIWSGGPKGEEAKLYLV